MSAEFPSDDNSSSASDKAKEDEEEYEPSPWHFKLLFIALILYLAYRFIEFVAWLVGKIL